MVSSTLVSGISVDCLLVLVVDDEAAMREVVSMRLADWGYDVCVAADGAEAGRLIQERHPDLVISDVVLPDMTGLELLSHLTAGEPTRPVIMMTAYGTVELAVDAMKQGAQDFLTKPLDYSKLKAVLAAAGRDLSLRTEVRDLDQELATQAETGAIIGTSSAIQAIRDLIQRVAATDASALITGKSGTGKELVVRTIHELSARRGGPFIAINAAAMAESLIESEIFGHEKGSFTGATGTRQGCFELAHHGTLLLDEIVEMPIALQPKLLRILEDGKVRRLGGTQEHHFDVRVLAATNRDPAEAVREGMLREDLFYRLSVFSISVPPLREHAEDIPLLAHHFIRHFNRKHGRAVEGLRDEARQRLMAYGWPGNVRELRNVMERAIVLANDWIEVSDLPPYFIDGNGGPPAAGSTDALAGLSLAEVEKRLILDTLERVGQNKAEAARRLKLDVKTIRNKLKSYGLG
jgi:two-component system response regulator HydG